jgi:hypothetical protein
MNDFAKQFEDLRIWQDARIQAVSLYRDFGTGMPAERDFGYRDQIQRVGVSVMNNIAKGSCGEVRSMLYLAEDLQYLAPEVALSRRERARQFSKGIESLAKSLRSK